MAAHLLRGLADAVAHGLHVALLLLQLLLQLGDPGLQATLLVLQGIPEGGQPRGPVPLPKDSEEARPGSPCQEGTWTGTGTFSHGPQHTTSRMKATGRGKLEGPFTRGPVPLEAQLSAVIANSKVGSRACWEPPLLPSGHAAGQLLRQLLLLQVRLLASPLGCGQVLQGSRRKGAVCREGPSTGPRAPSPSSLQAPAILKCQLLPELREARYASRGNASLSLSLWGRAWGWGSGKEIQGHTGLGCPGHHGGCRGWTTLPPAAA